MKSPTSLFSFALRGAALTALVLSLGTWIATGSHVGWTQTSVVQLQHDEITGIDFPVREPAFIAGLEVLAVGLAAASAFAGLSFLPRLRGAVSARS